MGRTLTPSPPTGPPTADSATTSSSSTDTGWLAHGQGGSPAPTLALLAIVLVIATAGLVYELVIAAVASYVLGDSVRQFSLIIGIYLSALGAGAYLSRFVERRLAATFIDVELSAALIGGLSAPGLLFAFSFTDAFRLLVFSTTFVVGVLVGLELPLLIRLLQRELEFKELIARALTFDYAGALLGSLSFGLFLMPKLGLAQSSLVCGLLNAGVAWVSTHLLSGRTELDARALRRARWRAVFVLLVLCAALFEAGRWTRLSEEALFGARSLVSEQTPYQRISLVERGSGMDLYLSGHLQFSSRDEHRYHEALVHPAMAAGERRSRVAIGGGGDGLAVREVLKWPGVERVTLVDLDERMTGLANREPLAKLNQHSLDDPRVVVVTEDAMRWFAETRERYDVIVLDFPDPSNYSLGKLYSLSFYESVRERLAEGGTLSVQATSPLYAPTAYASVIETLRAAAFQVLPYGVFLPSFGEWGFVLAALRELGVPRALPPARLRFLDEQTLKALFVRPPDLPVARARVNRLVNQALVDSYLDDWSKFD